MGLHIQCIFVRHDFHFDPWHTSAHVHPAPSPGHSKIKPNKYNDPSVSKQTQILLKKEHNSRVVHTKITCLAVLSFNPLIYAPISKIYLINQHFLTPFDHPYWLKHIMESFTIFTSSAIIDHVILYDFLQNDWLWLAIAYEVQKYHSK